MPSGKSSSSSENTTSTTTQDNKVSATDNAVALGNEASLTYTDQFSDNVKAAFEELVGLARDAGIVAAEFAQKSIAANQDAINKVADQSKQSVDAANLQGSTILKSFVPYAGVALVVLTFALAQKKGKK